MQFDTIREIFKIILKQILVNRVYDEFLKVFEIQTSVIISKLAMWGDFYFIYSGAPYF